MFKELNMRGGIVMTDYGKDLFEGTAWYYSRYRPLYPASLIRYLIGNFPLDGKGQMLDLGCGTGQLAFKFSDWFEGIVGKSSLNVDGVY